MRRKNLKGKEQENSEGWHRSPVNINDLIAPPSKIKPHNPIRVLTPQPEEIEQPEIFCPRCKGMRKFLGKECEVCKGEGKLYGL